ncbi:MAG: DUF4381 domain-containing protein [Synechococcus sp.]
MTATSTLFDRDFGNNQLLELQEIKLPEPVTWVPQTIGWFLLAGVLVAVFGLWGVKRYRHWRKNRYRRVAIQTLAEIEADIRAGELYSLARLASLLKRVALQAYPRNRVAPLQGEEWLCFLDATYGGTDFTQGAGRIVAEIAYAPPSSYRRLSASSIAELLQVTRQWIATHELVSPPHLAAIPSGRGGSRD